MSTAPILRHLYSLDTSSPDLSRLLYCLIRDDEQEQYLPNLQGPELARLVDFLDQAIDAVSANRDISRRCLHKLQEICGHCSTLPPSYIVSGEISRVGGSPITVGAVTDVWQGTYLTKEVSIKCLKVPSNDDQTLKKSFFEAAVMWKQLRHPNIVPFVGVTTDPLQIVSEWMSNGTLTEFLKENPGTNRISLLLDVAEGLEYLHANHAIHGDLDGSRILIGPDGHARLTDFGLVSIVRGMNSAAQNEEYMTSWAAPEILKGGGTITREADVFAFGMVVIEAFTGRHPFGESTAPVVTSKIMDGKRPARPQEAQGLGLTDSVWDMTTCCWHRDPTQRPTMTEAVRLLRECYRTASLWTKITDIPAKPLNPTATFTQEDDTPSRTLLPVAETEGVTSGAVQPPGPKRDDIVHTGTHSQDPGDESDPTTTFTEEDDTDELNAIGDLEDEEERLIINGGTGIPIGPDGVPRPLLPPCAPQHAGRKCLILDLDETLLHSTFKSIQHVDYVVPVEIERHWHNVYVTKRPGVDDFLKKMGELYEIVVFTASLGKYVDPVLDRLDVHRVVSHRLYRESCYNHKGNYVKDLSQLGRAMSDMIILDNSPASYIFHPNNAVPIASWFNDPHDTELADLCPVLTDLRFVDDVRVVLNSRL